MIVVRKFEPQPYPLEVRSPQAMNHLGQSIEIELVESDPLEDFGLEEGLPFLKDRSTG